MEIDFTTWPDGPSEKAYSQSANDLHLKSDTCTFPEPVSVEVTVQKSDDQAVVEGQVATTAQGTCVRCLVLFAIPVREEFRTVVKVVPDAEVGEDSGDDDFVLIAASHPVWNIGDASREIIMLALPDNPLCKDDCAGLCAGCGANLNLENCRCGPKPANPALARLGDILGTVRPKKN